MLDVIMNSGVATLESLNNKNYFNYEHAAFPVAVIITSPAFGLARQMGISIKLILLIKAAIITFVGFLSLKLKLNYQKESHLENDEVKQLKRPKVLLFTKSIIFFGFIGLLVHLMENAVEHWSTIYLE